MRRLNKEEDWVVTAAKCNACHFLQTPWRRWLNTCGELHISDGGDRERGFWAEPAHNDGAASILHLGLCLAGRKVVKFEQPGGKPDVILEIEPGGVYFGSVTGARHQVVHTEAVEHELARFGAEGRPCSIAVMMRTALFPHCRGRISDTTPSPWSAFECMTTAFRESLASLRFELPTLEECLPWAGECSPGTAATPAQEAGLTAECSRGTETTPAQETGMTVQDVVEGCSTKSAWCPAPLLKMADLALAAAPPPPGPERGAQLGSGTPGQVYRHASSDSLVIKVLQRPLDVLQDMSEVYALEKGRGHPHIVQLHDVAMDSSGMRKRLCLILERCDTDLEKLIRENSEDGPSPLQLRRTASQACSALRHLHAAGLVHMDLAAKNILVKWRQPGLTSGGASGSLYDIKIGDLGSVMQADPRARLRLDAKALEQSGVQLTTLCYRAPEILFGDQNFGTAADTWSLGMVLCFYARVCVCDALRMGTSTWNEVSYLTFLVTWLGTPPEGCFDALPHWPGCLPQVAEAKPWPSHAQTALGTRGCAFVRGLLRFPPTERSLDLDHAWFHPWRLVLGGRCVLPSGFLREGIISKPGLTGGSPEEALATPRKRKGGALTRGSPGEALATQSGRKRKLGASSQAELKEFRKNTRA